MSDGNKPESPCFVTKTGKSCGSARVIRHRDTCYQTPPTRAIRHPAFVLSDTDPLLEPSADAVSRIRNTRARSNSLSNSLNRWQRSGTAVDSSSEDREEQG